MNKRMLINLVMVIFVAGLFLTVSCAKQPVVSDTTTIEDQAKAKAEAEAAAAAKAAADAEAARIAQQKLEEQMAKEKAIKEIMEAKKRFVDQDILFAYDSSELSSEAKMMLTQKAEWLKSNSAVTVTIEGHCDERGTTDYNLALGERRANTVKSYLTDLSVAASRLNTISYGEEKPKDTAKTENAYQANRRAHFAIE